MSDSNQSIINTLDIVGIGYEDAPIEGRVHALAREYNRLRDANFQNQELRERLRETQLALGHLTVECDRVLPLLEAKAGAELFAGWVTALTIGAGIVSKLDEGLVEQIRALAGKDAA